MPLLAYFGLVGSILVGLLYVAEAQLGPPPKSVGLSTNFHGLPAPYKEASLSRTRILTVREAPAPPAVEERVAQATVTPSATAPTKIVVRPKAKKVAKGPKTPRQNIGQNIFAQSSTPFFGRNQHRVW